MNKAKELQNAVATLPSAELKEFREWFTAFDSDNWDKQIEADAEGGKLDQLATEALKKHRAGETTECETFYDP